MELSALLLLTNFSLLFLPYIRSSLSIEETHNKLSDNHEHKIWTVETRSSSEVSHHHQCLLWYFVKINSGIPVDRVRVRHQQILQENTPPSPTSFINPSSTLPSCSVAPSPPALMSHPCQSAPTLLSRTNWRLIPELVRHHPQPSLVSRRMWPWVLPTLRAARERCYRGVPVVSRYSILQHVLPWPRHWSQNLRCQEDLPHQCQGRQVDHHLRLTSPQLSISAPRDHPRPRHHCLTGTVWSSPVEPPVHHLRCSPSCSVPGTAHTATTAPERASPRYHKLIIIIIIILINICRGSLMKRKVLDLFSPVLPVTTLTCRRHLIFHPAAPPLSGFLFMFLYWRRWKNILIGREFRKKTSPSLLNLKSPGDSRRSSRHSPLTHSPSPLHSASSLSPKSFYSSPDYNSNNSNEGSPANKGQNKKNIFNLFYQSL